MGTHLEDPAPGPVAALCNEPNTLAEPGEDIAADVAASTPYWEACSASVEAYRLAASLLRADTHRFEARF